jgi:hypothetical protein
VADPGVAKLFVTTAYPSSGIAGVGPDHVLEVSGRNFPVGEEVTLLVRQGERLKQSVRAGKDGTFSTSVRVPEDLPYGTFTIEAIGGPEAKILAVADFFKSYAADEHPARDAPR